MPAPPATLVAHWSLANSGLSTGSVGWDLEKNGWPGFIANHARPAVEWCRASSVDPVLLVHHPWGQYTQEPMHIDGYDYAVAAGARWLLDEFNTKAGWRSISGEVPCYAYIGGADLTPRLKNLAPLELRAMIIRNLAPLVSAGFRGCFVDYAENAITVDYAGVNDLQSNKRSVDTITLEIIDQMFPDPAGLEIAPRAFSPFSPLWWRPLVALDANWQYRYGPNGRDSNYEVLGYDRSVLTGRVIRTLNYSDDSAGVVEAARQIASEGDVPGVHTQPLIRAGVAAAEIFEGIKTDE